MNDFFILEGKEKMSKIKKATLLMIALIGMIFLSCAKELPTNKHALTSRKFQGIPSMAISPEGRLWAIWYAGKTPGEDENNYVVVSTSGDGGNSWIEKLTIDPDGEGPVRANDPELWIDPDGKLWLFWAQMIGHDGAKSGVWVKTNSDPDDENSKWSEPKRITDGVMACKPTVLSTGEWILPVSTWRETDNSARVVVSKDKGKTFTIRGACDVPKKVRDYDEHMIVERKDKSLWMLIRTNYGIGESISNDRGETWSVPTESVIQHPSARFFIRRLTSGNLLLVKHGPINEKIGRAYLTAYVSEDDGHTWIGGLLLDERYSVSYPDGQQSSDGTIHIIYDYSRTADREIVMATFTENDVLTGNSESATVSLRMIVSKYSDMGFSSKRIFINEATVKIIPLQKNNEIRYTTDGSKPNRSSLLYAEPFNVTNTIKLKIVEFTPDGLERPVYESHYIKQKPIKSITVRANISGLNFEYFELPEKIDSLAGLKKFKSTRNGNVDRFIYPTEIKKLPEYFGMNFSGYIRIPKEDVYTFGLLSNDGSSLSIADKLVVDNDGLHGAYEKEGEIPLQKGWHKIELSYFQAGGGKNLKVYWRNSDFERKEITVEDLSSN